MAAGGANEVKLNFRFDYQAIKQSDASLGGAMGKEEGLTEKGIEELRQLAFPILSLEKYKRLLMRIQVMEIQQLKQEWKPLHETIGGVVDRHLNTLLDDLDESQQEVLISSLLIQYIKFLYGPAMNQESDMLDPARYKVKKLEEQIKQNIPTLQHVKFLELNSRDKKILATTSKKMKSLSKRREPIQTRINAIKKASVFSEFEDLFYCSLDEFCNQLTSIIVEKWFDKKMLPRVQGMLKATILMNYMQNFEKLQVKGIVNPNPDEEYFLKEENIFFSSHFKSVAFSFLINNSKSFFLNSGELSILSISSSLDLLWTQYEPVHDLQISPRTSIGGVRKAAFVHRPFLRHFSSSNFINELPTMPSSVPSLNIDWTGIPFQIEDPMRTQSARDSHEKNANPRGADPRISEASNELISDLNELQIAKPLAVTFSEEASIVSGSLSLSKKISPRIQEVVEVFEDLERQNSNPSLVEKRISGLPKPHS